LIKFNGYVTNDFKVFIQEFDGKPAIYIDADFLLKKLNSSDAYWINELRLDAIVEYYNDKLENKNVKQ